MIALMSPNGNYTQLSASTIQLAPTGLGFFKAEGQAREDAPGWITEIGGRMVFTEHIAMKLGYKWETTKGEVSHVKDSFRGTVLEITYAF